MVTLQLLVSRVDVTQREQNTLIRVLSGDAQDVIHHIGEEVVAELSPAIPCRGIVVLIVQPTWNAGIDDLAGQVG